jgi:hypothetical protein
MNPALTKTNSLIYYRLIALWVLCEAMLGSIIFTFKIPVSGLVIGGCAVVCISLIAWYVPAKGSILKATIIVAIFKMMLSPQAPPPAYIAVFFQGFIGELLFWNKRYFRVACILLAVLAMTESAFQRIIAITIIYGKDFWTAVNEFLNKLTGSTQLTDYSFFIILWYILLHVITGLLLGLWIGFLPAKIQMMRGFQKKYSIETSETTLNIPQRKRKKTWRILLFITWLALIALYVQAFFKIGDPVLPSHMAWRVLVRSVIIILTWYFFISPALKQLLHKWLQQKKQQSMQQVQQVLNLLPSTQGLMNRSWQLSSEKKGWKRIILCLKIILANTFYAAES